MSLRAGGLLAGVLTLVGCAAVPQRAPQNAAGLPAATAGVYVRYFSGVLILPADYVFEGTALPQITRFQGPRGALRLGSRADLDAGNYLAEARRTLRTRESLCGLEVLAHGSDPVRWLLVDARAYALFYDRDEDAARRLLTGYCDTRHDPAP